MDTFINQENLRTNIPVKKDWKKPILTTIIAKELTEYIKASAKSVEDGGVCYTLAR